MSKKSKQSLPDLKNKSLLLTESSGVFRAEAGVVNCHKKIFAVLISADVKFQVFFPK